MILTDDIFQWILVSKACEEVLSRHRRLTQQFAVSWLYDLPVLLLEYRLNRHLILFPSTVSFTAAGAVAAGGVLTYTMLVAGAAAAAAAASALWLAFCGIVCVLEAPAPGDERCDRFRPVS
jgi:hypothetical protein